MPFKHFYCRNMADSNPNLKQQILDVYPTPKNIISKKTLDGNIRAILSEKGEKYCLLRDNKAFENVREKIGQIMGPLSHIWDFFENQKMNAKMNFEANNDSVEVEETSSTANEFSKLMDMNIKMIGQAFNSASYYSADAIYLFDKASQ